MCVSVCVCVCVCFQVKSVSQVSCALLNFPCSCVPPPPAAHPAKESNLAYLIT